MLQKQHAMIMNPTDQASAKQVAILQQVRFLPTITTKRPMQLWPMCSDNKRSRIRNDIQKMSVENNNFGLFFSQWCLNSKHVDVV